MRRWLLVSAVCGVLLAVAAALHSRRTLTKAGNNGGRRIVDVRYGFRVTEIPADARAILAWVPVPPSNRWQCLQEFWTEDGWPYTALVDPEYGNRFLRFDLSRGVAPDREELDLAVTFRVSRDAARIGDTTREDESPSQASLARHLGPDRLVPTDGRIAQEAERVAAGVGEPFARARRLYEHIVSTVVYDKSGQGWGRGDARYACDIRAGNCTDFHSLFIGQARALGIPARFVMGLSLPDGASDGAIAGYHCWAEFYVAGRGWIPIDASEASKRRERQDALFGGLDANRIEFTIGRDIHIPETSAGALNYVIYPYVEIDGSAHGNVATRFSFRDVGAS